MFAADDRRRRCEVVKSGEKGDGASVNNASYVFHKWHSLFWLTDAALSDVNTFPSANEMAK